MSLKTTCGLPETKGRPSEKTMTLPLKYLYLHSEKRVLSGHANNNVSHKQEKHHFKPQVMQKATLDISSKVMMLSCKSNTQLFPKEIRDDNIYIL
jgi:hypothetical protein